MLSNNYLVRPDSQNLVFCGGADFLHACTIYIYRTFLATNYVFHTDSAKNGLGLFRKRPTTTPPPKKKLNGDPLHTYILKTKTKSLHAYSCCHMTCIWCTDFSCNLAGNWGRSLRPCPVCSPARFYTIVCLFGITPTQITVESIRSAAHASPCTWCVTVRLQERRRVPSSEPKVNLLLLILLHALPPPSWILSFSFAPC